MQDISNSQPNHNSDQILNGRIPRSVRTRSKTLLSAIPRRSYRSFAFDNNNISNKIYRKTKSSPDLDPSMIISDHHGPIRLEEEIGSGSYSNVYRGIRICISENLQHEPQPKDTSTPHLKSIQQSNDEKNDLNLNDEGGKNDLNLNNEGGKNDLNLNDEGGKDVAVKLLLNSDNSEEYRRNFESEYFILDRLKTSSYVVKLLGVIDNVGFVLEYCCNGDLYTYLNSDSLVTVEICKRFILEAIHGVKVLHTMEPPILHRDIKSLNFLIDNNFHLKLSDFGLSRIDSQHHRKNTFRTLRTSLLYAPPEFLDDDSVYTIYSDIYSLTIVIWEILFTFFTEKYSPPYKVNNPWQTLMIISKGERPVIDTPPFNQQQIEMLQLGWSQNPSDRPDINQLLQMATDLNIIKPDH